MAHGNSQKGSALVIALMVAFILSLLGASFLLMAQTEIRIADNEKLAAQALYAAEAGVLAVKGWFDRPDTALEFPEPDQIERDNRRILDETDPYGPEDSLPTEPLYKQDEDRDLDGADDVFERPYRGSLTHALMGTESYPDMTIDDEGSAAERDFLDQLSQALLGSFPSVEAKLRARISRIDVYAPPYVRIGGSWSRFGMATVKVVARIYSGDWAERSILAERTIRAVLNELPYSTPVFGPLHTCGDLELTGNLNVHWGAVTATGRLLGYDPGSPNVSASLPRTVPPGPRIDRLWTNSPAWVADFTANVDPAQGITDPWLRVVVGGVIEGVPDDDQPYPPNVPTADPPPWPCCDASNLVQNHPLVSCPAYDYEFWKNVARSGGPDVHYFVYAGEQNGEATFQDNGIGESRTVREITEDRPGLYFFDTEDGQAPLDDDGDGELDNLTPKVRLSDTWSGSGFYYLNAEALESADLSGGSEPLVFRAPGEPYLDVDGDGRFNLPDDVWINLAYGPTRLDPFFVDPDDGLQDDGTLTGPVVRNSQGREFDDSVSFHGILYTSGVFEANGVGDYYGSVIARSGVKIGEVAPGPDMFWDATIGPDWPPDSLSLPRVAINRWDETP